MLGPYKALLEQWVAEDEKKPKKKRRTAKRMYTVLRGAEYGYQGAASSVRMYVGQLRKKVRNKVYVPLSYEAGEVGQVDFGEAEVILAGEKVPAQLFLMWLGYSGGTFVKAYPGQSQEIFFDGQVAACEFFGGVPRQLWFDNLKAAVLKVLKGSQRVEQQRFVAFRSHYLFEAHFCNVRAGWEKGGVESRVGYVRRNWLIPVMEFPSWEALNEYLRTQCEQEFGRRLRGRAETIGERLSQEQAQFLPLPERAFACCTTVPGQPNRLSLVSFATNRYSVPVDVAHKKLVLRAFPQRVEIADQHQLVAQHPRCWAREQDILDPQHYLGLLTRRPRAFERARPLRQWRETWPPVFETYWTVLKERFPDHQGTGVFIRILQLCTDYAEETLAEALEMALVCHCYNYDGVRELVRRVAEPARPEPADLSSHPTLARVRVPPPDLGRFNQLLSAGDDA
ncbi:MAG: IS21 family transposase [Rhodobacteraceae bacterium]|nr:IS21 family transposase [Paracoccaceae bacterium]